MKKSRSEKKAAKQLVILEYWRIFYFYGTNFSVKSHASLKMARILLESRQNSARSSINTRSKSNIENTDNEPPQAILGRLLIQIDTEGNRRQREPPKLASTCR